MGFLILSFFETVSRNVLWKSSESLVVLVFFLGLF